MGLQYSVLVQNDVCVGSLYQPEMGTESGKTNNTPSLAVGKGEGMFGSKGPSLQTDPPDPPDPPRGLDGSPLDLALEA